ncbi:MAG: ATP-binding protein, partial [Candidatus Korarchaeota archaeon]|nr:ATP-binding protein [Candidatus Korarchaeota archaeon]
MSSGYEGESEFRPESGLGSGIGIEGEEVGTIVGAASPVELTIACEGSPPALWEYVVFPSVEEVGWEGKRRPVHVLAQVAMPYRESLVLTETTDPEAIRKIREMGADNPLSYAQLRVLGYVDPELKAVRSPRHAPRPGTPVYRAPDEVLQQFYEFPEEERVRIGGLVTRRGVSVDLSVNGFRRHLAILAATGAGKSYATGLIVEQLLEKGASVVIIDPHADYVYLGVRQAEKGFEEMDLARNVIILRNPGSSGDYKGIVGKERVKEYTVAFSSLDSEMVYELAGIRPGWTNVRKVVEDAMKEVREELGESYTVEDIVKKLNSMAESANAKDVAAMRSAAVRLSNLRYLRLFGRTTTRVVDILKEPRRALVVDLSGATDFEMDVATHLIVDSIFEARMKGEINYPVFLFVEEAHRVIPKGKKTLSYSSLIKVAREGRKFGVFLTIISQRPSAVDPDVLSMCQSMIVMKTVNPADQQAIRQAAEKMSEDLL